MAQISKCTLSVIFVILATSCILQPSANPINKNQTESNELLDIIETTKMSPPSNSSNNLLEFQNNLRLPDCDSLCWRGIKPGITTRNEAEKNLADTYGNENIEFDGVFLTWLSNGADLSYSGNLRFLDNTVDEITIKFDEEVLMVSDLIGIIGKPDFVRLAIAFSSEADCAGAALYYTNKGLDVWIYPDSDKEIVGVEKSQSISSLRMLSPRLSENWHVTDSYEVEWNGYQDYCSSINHWDD